jgi:hypothetical protein
MQLRKMNENGGRNVRTPAARLVQAEHLKASRNGEEEDRWREEHANVMVCYAYGFEAGGGCHLGYRFHGTSKVQPELQ